MSTPDDETEPRVRDLLRREDGDESEFAAWFERPSFAHLAELAAGMPARPPGADDDLDLDPEVLAVRKRRAAAAANVDPALLAKLYLHDEVVAQFLPRPPPPGFDERPSMLMFDERKVPAIPLDEDWRQIERSEALEDAIKICTPQANLRDLHRPETDFYITYRPAFEDLPEFVGLDGYAHTIREVLGADYQRQASWRSAAQQIAESEAERRGLMALPWAAAKSERGRLREAEREAEAQAAAARKEAEAMAVAKGPEGSR